MDTRARAQWDADYPLTRLFLAGELGDRPADEAAEDAAIARATEALMAAATEEGAIARRIVAIEYAAWSGPRRGWRSRTRPPSGADFERALALVDAVADDEVRRMARGGMVFQAVWHWGRRG